MEKSFAWIRAALRYLKISFFTEVSRATAPLIGLFCNGKDLPYLPLADRKHKLHGLVPRNGERLYCDYVEGMGEELFHLVCERDPEGVVAKRKFDPYLLDHRGWRFATGHIPNGCEKSCLSVTKREHAKLLDVGLEVGQVNEWETVAERLPWWAS
jgi:hypothetical protein